MREILLGPRGREAERRLQQLEARIDGELSTLRTQIDSLHTLVGTLRARLDDQADDSARIDHRVDGFEPRVAQLARSLDERAAQLRGLESRWQSSSSRNEQRWSDAQAAIEGARTAAEDARSLAEQTSRRAIERRTLVQLFRDLADRLAAEDRDPSPD